MDLTADNEGRFRQVEPEAVDSWKVACGRLLRVGRRGPLPTSLGELGRLTGLPPSRLRESEKLAERRDTELSRATASGRAPSAPITSET